VLSERDCSPLRGDESGCLPPFVDRDNSGCSWDAGRIAGLAPPQPVMRYQLTTDEEKYFRQIPGTFGQTGGFCYGQKTVDSIVKWTEEPQAQAEAMYTYKIVNLAAWAESSDIQEAFPDIRATISGASKTNQIVGLELTNKGWEIPGS
jgi:hypothetical protein